MKIYKKPVNSSENIMCMANMRGNKIVRPHHMPFSFYYSADPHAGHSIRVKPLFKNNKFSIDDAGTLDLHSDWEYIRGREDENVPAKDIKEMKQFFRDNIVLFAAVWDRQLPESDIEDYLEGDMELSDLVQDLTFYAEYSAELDQITTIEELEEFCRKNQLVNLYGN
jgi:hypothetical protein